MRDSFSQRVNSDEKQTWDSIEEALEWELKEDGKAGEVETASEGEGVEGSYGAPGDGAETGSSDLGVEVAVPEVIDRATSTAHDEGAAEEEK